MGAISCANRRATTPSVAGAWIAEIYAPNSGAKISILEISLEHQSVSTDGAVRLLRTAPGVAVSPTYFQEYDSTERALCCLAVAWAQNPSIPLSWVADIRRAYMNSDFFRSGVCWTFPRGLKLEYGTSLSIASIFGSASSYDISVLAEV